MNYNNLLKAALAGALTLGVATVAAASPGPSGPNDMKSGKMSMVKCYGINAAHKNDCKSPGHSCAGQDDKSRDPSAFVAMPSGLCEKIDGGSTTPAKA